MLCSTFMLQERELNDLKRKSPSDLWKEDLAAFVEELEVCFTLYIFLKHEMHTNLIKNTD